MKFGPVHCLVTSAAITAVILMIIYRESLRDEKTRNDTLMYNVIIPSVVVGIIGLAISHIFKPKNTLSTVTDMFNDDKAMLAEPFYD